MNDLVSKPSTLFKKGQSGNPAGRPKGSKNQITLLKIQMEGELRAQMRSQMPAVVAEMIRQALPSPLLIKGVVQKDSDGNTIMSPGDAEMLKTLYKSWVSNTKASDDEAPREKIQIVIGKLDQIPAVNGQVFPQSTTDE